MRRFYSGINFLYNILSLRRNLRRKRSELVKLQEKKLRAIIRHAYQTVPFYHKLFKTHGIEPQAIRSVDDLWKLPMITKKDVQENFQNMISKSVKISDCIKQKTSGSTGLPLTILKDKNALDFQHAVSMRQFFECGGRLRDKVVQLRWTGAGAVPPDVKKSYYWNYFPQKNLWILADRLPLKDIIEILNSYNPDVIVSYPGLLKLVAEIPNLKIRPRLIFSTAEILGKYVRTLIGESLGARVIDSYGCVEAGDIAWECPYGYRGYHMNVDSVVIEFVKEGQNVAPGEDGEVVLTTLFNYAMPLIRYRIGDVASFSDERCPCGITLPLMSSLKGRCNDFIVLPDGRELPPWLFWNSIDLTGVAGFRIIQEKIDVIRVLLKVSKSYEKKQVEKTTRGLKRIFGDQVELKIDIVNELPRDSSGKMRSVISKVRS